MGFEYQSIPGDSHCLYSAVGLYLGETVENLRRMVAAHLEHNLEELAPFIVLPTGKSLTDYLNAVRTGTEWATNVEIEVLMRVLNQPILAVGPDAQIINRADTERFSGAPIFVYYNGHNHYDGLVLNENTNVQEALNGLLHPTASQERIIQLSEYFPQQISQESSDIIRHNPRLFNKSHSQRMAEQTLTQSVHDIEEQPEVSHSLRLRRTGSNNGV